jgi:hypothetical protein
VIWPQSDKDALQSAFAAAWNSGSIQVNDLPPNILHPADHSSPTTALSHADAHSLYLASVGQSLAVEIDSRVGWSVANYSNENLAILFDSREFFVWSASDNGYEIQDLKGGSVVPASPYRMHRFLKDNDLIGDHRRGTIERMLKWCHHNLSHFFGGYETKTMLDVWQYRGWAPVLRTIEGTKDHANRELGAALDSRLSRYRRLSARNSADSEYSSRARPSMRPRAAFFFSRRASSQSRR